MPAHPRYMFIEDGSTFHVTWQCHNQEWLLHEDWAKKIYYDLLLKYKDRYRVCFYSYHLMSNHPHLIGYCEHKSLFSDFFRTVNSIFARQYNKRMRRRGQVVMDRFKSPRIKTDQDLLEVMFYADLNSTRKAMVSHPKDYKWSSYRHYAYGEKDPLITDSPAYLLIGINDQGRQEAYRAMVDKIMKEDLMKKQPYSSVPFIGNPQWVLEKSYDLKKKEKEMREKRKKRYELKFRGASKKFEGSILHTAQPNQPSTFVKCGEKIRV